MAIPLLSHFPWDIYVSIIRNLLMFLLYKHLVGMLSIINYMCMIF